MQTNTHKIEDYDAILDSRYGAEGTDSRNAFEEEARAFYASQILLKARKEVGLTQAELAKRVGTSKSYISKIETGSVEPSVGLFYRIISALGLRVEIVKPLGV